MANGRYFPRAQCLPVPRDEIARDMQNSWIKLIGGAPSPTAIKVLLGHSMLETGRWAKMAAYNLGNMRLAPSQFDSDNIPLIDFTCQAADENLSVPGHPYVKYDDTPHKPNQDFKGDPGNCFRAWPTLPEASDSYISYMKGHGLHTAAAGGVDGFCNGLIAAHYFTAVPDWYRGGLVACVKELGGYTLPAPAATSQPTLQEASNPFTQVSPKNQPGTKGSNDGWKVPDGQKVKETYQVQTVTPGAPPTVFRMKSPDAGAAGGGSGNGPGGNPGGGNNP